jgi:uncharacterized OB-fold protein
MKLALSASKRYVKAVSGSKEEIVFAVVDLDKAGSYPLNFVCMLPKVLEREFKPSNNFLKIYGKESRQIAIDLLTNALERQDDLKVRDEIERRLEALRPKTIITANCVNCGCVFEPKKFGRYLQRVCQACRSKNESNHY